jgi:antitoxin ParD1/3/4
MSITVTPETEREIRHWIESGHYPDADAVLNDALGLLHERKLATLRAKIQSGLDQIERGEGIELTPEVWDEIEREADEALLRGEQPDPDVCP